MALYSQATQRIEVVVKGEGVGVATGTGKKGNKKQTEEETSQGSIWESLTGSTSEKRQKRVLLTNATHLLSTSKQVARQYLQYRLSGAGYKFGDQSYQQLVQRNLEQYEDVVSVGSGILMGATYGSWGGPIGIAVGIITGAVSSLASLSSKYATRERENDVKVFKENNGIQYLRARSGIDLTTGRLR